MNASTTSLRVPSTEPRQEVFEGMRTEVKQWLSDCGHAKEEIAFFERLLSRLALWVGPDEKRELINDQMKKINNLELHRSLCERVIGGHLIQVEAVIRTSLAGDQQTIIEDNQNLKNGILDFSRNLQKSRIEVFGFIERVADANRIHRLLESRNDLYNFED